MIVTRQLVMESITNCLVTIVLTMEGVFEWLADRLQILQITFT